MVVPQNAAPDPKNEITNDDFGFAEDVPEPLGLRISRFLQLCLKRQKLILRIVVIGTSLCILAALMERNFYTSTTSLMPPESASTSSASLMNLLSTVGPIMGGGGSSFGRRTPGSTFVGVLDSRAVHENLVNRFDLMHLYKVHYMDDACKILAASSDIKEDVKTGIISISVTSRDPVLSSKLAAAYVEELNAVVTHNSSSAAGKERVFLEGRLKQIKQDLDSSAQALSRFSAKNKTLDIEAQGKAMVESGLKMEDQLAAARAQLAGLRQSYSEDNVRVRAAEAQVAALQHQVDKMVGSSSSSSNGNSANSSDYPSVAQLPGLGVTYFDLQRNMRVEEMLWEAMTKQYEAARIEEAKETPAVRVLDAANIPQRKSGPHRSVFVIVGAFLSFIVALVVVFISSFWETMDPYDERKKFVLALVGPEGLPGMRWLAKRIK